VNLGRWFLNNTTHRLTRWRMSEMTLARDERLLRFVSSILQGHHPSTVKGHRVALPQPLIVEST